MLEFYVRLIVLGAWYMFSMYSKHLQIINNRICLYIIGVYLLQVSNSIGTTLFRLNGPPMWSPGIWVLEGVITSIGIGVVLYWYLKGPLKPVQLCPITDDTYLTRIRALKELEKYKKGG